MIVTKVFIGSLLALLAVGLFLFRFVVAYVEDPRYRGEE